LPFAVPPRQRKLGQILVSRGILSPITVDRVLPLCQKHHKRFGEFLLEIGFITGDELAEALAEQYGYQKITQFAHNRFPQDLLNLISLETAMMHTIFPLKSFGKSLALAMMDPTNRKIIENIEANQTVRVIPIVASRTHIIEAIARHYLGRPLAQNERESVLIVDNCVTSRNSMATTLKQKGYLVRAADNGIDAFKEVIADNPSLVITEKDIPKLNGYALLDALNKVPETRKIPVILVSSNENRVEEALAYDRGFTEFMTKPFEDMILIAKVKRALAPLRLLI
jgi:CheY-like chemotaxis protein